MDLLEMIHSEPKKLALFRRLWHYLVYTRQEEKDSFQNLVEGLLKSSFAMPE